MTKYHSVVSALALAAFCMWCGHAQADHPKGVSPEQWGLTSPDFYRMIEVNGRPRFTSFADKGADDTGAAVYRFVPGEGDTSLAFGVFGGRGSVLLVRGLEDAELPSGADFPAWARSLRAGELGQVVEAVDGPNSTDAPRRVRWDLTPHRGEPLSLVILDDRVGPWGFLGVSSLRWNVGVAPNRPQPAGGVDAIPAGQHPVLRAATPVRLSSGPGVVLMPGGADWGRTDGVFFDRRLHQNRIPFVSTLQRQLRDDAIGATWCVVEHDGWPYELTFGVKGGHGRLVLIRGDAGVDQWRDVSDIAAALSGPMSSRIVESVSGPGQQGPFQDVVWDLPQAPQPGRYTIVLIDTSARPWGFVDVTSIRAQRR